MKQLQNYLKIPETGMEDSEGFLWSYIVNESNACEKKIFINGSKFIFIHIEQKIQIFFNIHNIQKFWLSVFNIYTQNWSLLSVFFIYR